MKTEKLVELNRLVAEFLRIVNNAELLADSILKYKEDLIEVNEAKTTLKRIEKELCGAEVDFSDLLDKGEI